MRFLSEFLGESRDFSRWEIAGLLRAYGGRVLEEKERYIIFETGKPDEIINRVTYSRRVGRIIEDSESFALKGNGTFKIREIKDKSEESHIDEFAKKINGQVNLDNPDTTFYLYDPGELTATELIYERSMKRLIDSRYPGRPVIHPSSISSIIARGMINVSGVKEGDSFIDPFAGTGTYLIEGFRMGINGYGIDKNRDMVNGGNRNLEYFSFKPSISLGDFANFLSYSKINAVITDPPYGRGSRIFSQSRNSLYKDFFSALGDFNGTAVFCLPGEDLLEIANEFLDLELIAKIRVHSSLTRIIAASFS